MHPDYDPPHPFPAIERVANVNGVLESSLASDLVLTDSLFLGVRMTHAQGVQLRIGGRLIFAESGSRERVFELPILARKNTKIELVVKDGVVELLGYELRRSQIDRAAAYVRSKNGLIL